MQNNRTRSLIHYHFIVFLFGFSSILGALISISSIPLVIYRMVIAAIGLIICFVLFDFKKLLLKKSILLKVIICGIIIGLHWITFFYAIKISNVPITLSMMSSGAFLTALIEPFFFRKKIKTYELLLGLLVVLGIVIIFNAELLYLKGLLIALISAFLSSLFTIINSGIIKTSSSLTISFYELLFGFIAVFLCYFIFYDEAVSDFYLNGNDFFFLILMGLLCTSYAFNVSIAVMKYLKPFTVMMILNMEPIYGILLSLFIFGENDYMSVNFYFGFLIIIFAIILNGFFKLKKR
jgi:drug/metabolite transporter (DMT)-like permease